MVIEQIVVLGIETSAKLGRILQEEHPEVAERYRNGERRVDIIKRLNLTDNYNVTYAVARAALGYALCGYDGYGKEKAYAGLINEEELSKLGEGNRKNGCKTTGIASTLRRGQTPYTPEERARVYNYVKDERYSHREGSRRGHPDWKKIAEKLSSEFGREITVCSAINAFRTHQKNL